MENPIFTINLVVYNGEKFIRWTLDSILAQTYKNYEINILDNNSNDQTREIIRKDYPMCRLIQNAENIGFLDGQEKLFSESKGDYIVAVSDVILDKNFLQNALKILETDNQVGAIQAKIYQMNLYPVRNSPPIGPSDRASAGAISYGVYDRAEPEFTDIIDTVGFKIYKSRKLVNEGHGERDNGQFNRQKEIFGTEGAVPIFRKKALEDCKIQGRFIDPDYREGALCYADPDLAWRLNLFGWKQIYCPDVIAYHDRSTTKGFSKKWSDYFKRLSERRKIDIAKRRLSWLNAHFTIIKNDYIINILKDLPYILKREIMVLGYIILFEPKVLLEIPSLFKLLPKMLSRRKEIMRRAKTNPIEIKKWFL